MPDIQISWGASPCYGLQTRRASNRYEIIACWSKPGKESRQVRSASFKVTHSCQWTGANKGERRPASVGHRMKPRKGAMEEPGRMAETRALDHTAREMQELELALLLRGVERADGWMRAMRSLHRTPLIGERVYRYGAERVAVRAVPVAALSAAGLGSSMDPSSATRCGSPIIASRLSRLRRGQPGPPRPNPSPSIKSRPWTPSRSRRRSPSPASRCSSTSRTSPTRQSSATTTWSNGTCSVRTPTAGGRRPVPGQGAAQPLRVGRHDPRRAAGAVPDRRAGRSGKYNRVRRLGTYTLSPGRAGPRRSSTRSRPCPCSCPTG